MINLSLSQCFGDNTLQNSNSLVIQKSDLPGLTPTTNNTAEELVVGILLKILENFEGSITDENNTPITTENSTSITYKQGDIFDSFFLESWRIVFTKRNNSNYRTYQLVFHKFEEYAD
jgi:hypothetical protein